MDKHTENNISIKQRIAVSFKMLKQAWILRRSSVVTFFFGAILEIAGSLVAIYASARLGGLLAKFATTGNTTGIWPWFWVSAAAGAVTGVGFLIMSYAKRIMYFSFVRWSTNAFLKTLTEIDLPKFYDDATRNQINKVATSYTWQLSNLADSNLDLMYAILRFIAITAVVSQINWWVVPMIGVFLIPTLLSEARIAKLQWFVWDQKGDERHVFWGLEHILRNARGQMELRSSQASTYVLGKINSMNKQFYNEQEDRYRESRGIALSAQLLDSIGPSVAGIVVLLQFLSKAISFERYLFLTGALFRVNGALNTIFGTVTRMQEPLLVAHSYFDLVENSTRVSDDPKAVKLADSTTPEIEFKNVSFSYPGQSTPVFEDLSLTIKPGEHVALVGENGAGKSTLIKLLLRFYKPTSGQILVNGIDLNTITLESWYEQLATLFQVFNQYPFPIDENIAVGRSSKKQDAKLLNQSAKFGGVDEMVKSYKHGWDTVLDSSFKKGIEPSGGQWQRVALARAFYRQAKILILDEPTSAIDAKAEYNIFNNIFDHYKNKSAIIVSHRFSTVRRADRIIVLDQGKIIEEGTHQQLMKHKDLYESLFTKQAEGYRD